MDKLTIIILLAIIAVSGVAAGYHYYGGEKLQSQTQLKIQNQTKLQNQTQIRNQTRYMNQSCLSVDQLNSANGNLIQYQDQNMFSGGSLHQEQNRNRIRNKT
ncbi:MAG TPA: hypothetical protein PLO64_05270 [Methanothermobacter sp.]|nr:histidine ammonia-lyase [Methanothermobacter sp. MT-2]HHW04454.1 hypothetical protein [Methanothermobacter sp.]HOK73016.1 hypothetical protein [Methanothermobacter sp.]HOL69322.1 hypothetical protein [Methanothermobacter sp.]HPQ04540.1 hypothetical protein [Methanothermobacter sp.]